MFKGRTRAIVTVTAMIEGGLASWALGAGWLGLLAMVALVTAVDSLWGVLRPERYRPLTRQGAARRTG